MSRIYIYNDFYVRKEEIKVYLYKETKINKALL